MIALPNRGTELDGTSLRKRATGAALALLAVPVLGAALAGYALFVQHGEVLNVEAMGVLHARRWAAGLPIYEDWRRFPHAIAPYGPANYVVPGLATRALGLSVHGTFLAMRSVSLLSFAALVVVLSMALRERSGGARAALACVALLVGSDLTTQFAVCSRPDLPSLLLQSLGLALLGHGVVAPRRIVMAAIPLALACAFKQVAILATLAGAAWLLASQRGRRRLTSAGALLALVGIPGVFFVAAAERATHGAFLLNTVASQAFPRSAEHLVALLHAALPVAPLAVAGAWGLSSARSRRLMGPFGAYYVIGLAWALAGGCRAGSWVNYFFEMAIAGTVGLACVLGTAPRSGAVLLVVLSALALAGGAPRVGPRLELARAAADDARDVDALYDELAREVSRGRGALMTDDPYLALASGHPEAATDGFHAAGLAQIGRLAVTEGESLLEARAFDPVVLRRPAAGVPGVPWWPPAWRGAMEGRYRQTRAYASGHVVFRPVRPQGPPR